MKIGILGGGQLGQMLALAVRPLGIHVRAFDSSADCPAGQVTETIVGDFSDAKSLDRFAEGMDVITYEFENAPVATAERLASRIQVFPPPRALEVSQDRLNEKRLFGQLGIPTVAHAPLDSFEDLERAVQQVSLPAILKTRRLGYDGKGQFILRSRDDTARAWQVLKGGSFILESLIEFDRELSVIAVRDQKRKTLFYPLIENHHKDGILRWSLAPAPEVAANIQQQAEQYATRVLDELAYVGVLTIEFFESNGQLIANEMAPRVHNSGHWTIEGATTSQFENHMRAIAGMPLGSTSANTCSLMINLIGRTDGAEAAKSISGAHVHLYGKSPRPGRKLGHITLLKESVEEAMLTVSQLPQPLRSCLTDIEPQASLAL
jgi:5-(carboxyamino)imidazole ribonucleotide synthase